MNTIQNYNSATQYHKKLLFVLCIVFFTLFNHSLLAQSVTGSLEGRIINENGLAIESAELFLLNKNNSNVRISTSDDNGNFNFLLLPPGKYNLKVTKPFFQTLVIENITTILGKTVSEPEIILHPNTYKLDEIFITASKTSIDQTSTTSGNSLSNNLFELLPIERNYKSISTIIPQANLSYLGDEINISGSTGLENVFYIDGANVTDPADAASSMQLPYNFIEAIEIKTGGYEAEYGRSLGGMINVITPSGKNEMEGKAFGFFTNSNLGGEAKAGLSSAKISNFAEYDFGASISGSIIKDRLFFFTAYNPNFDHSDIELSTFGTFENKSSAHLFAGKLTWQPTSNSNLMISIIGNPRTRNQVLVDDVGEFNLLNPDVILQKRDDGGVNISINGSHVYNKYLLLEGTVSSLSQIETMEPETEKGWNDGLYIDYIKGTVSGGRQVVQDDKYGRISARISTSLFLPNHQIKFGIEYEDNYYNLNLKNISDLSWVVRTDISTWYAQYINYTGKARNRILTGYLQDSWKIGNNFRINGGVRFDNQYFIGSSGEVVQKISDQFQPRLGIVFNHGDIFRTKYFASFGRFYEQIPTRFVALNYTDSKQYLTVFDHNPLEDESGGMKMDLSSPGQMEINNLEGQYFDEYVVGIVQVLPNNFKIGISGTYRNIGQIIDDFINLETGEKMIGNPGSERIYFIPELSRIYQSIEVFANKIVGDNYHILASYVFSKNSGNYTGLYNQDGGDFLPNMNPMPDYDFQLDNSSGLLPNNITHMLKISGSYKFNFGLLMGFNFLWQSGSPLSEYGVDKYGLQVPVFISKRGSYGNAPDLTNLDIRFKYDLASIFSQHKNINIIVDIFNVFDQKNGVRFDQQHYYSTDENGNPSVENPNFLNAIKYAPPRTIRIGIEAEIF
ncbi:MAG: TonB-dependent receptor [Bacteroidetes bacterium]|nr:TonB-dependent receptor [Bacteroidota bacterium]MBU1114340.1 TonB-dependent receptor [Bacteroidota bacterium]MBU1797118.1 TonB-dependent receptor [Bacteroidota bacterium]